MSILLQLESALADVRGSLERAAEKLHDTGIAHALAKSEYDMASDAVKRVEGALSSMHGISLVPATAQAPDTPAPLRAAPVPKKPEGPACPACGAKGKLGIVMIGQSRFAQCAECNAQIPQ